MPVAAIEISIVPIVRCLSYAATAMSHHFCEPTIFWAERIVVTQMPLPEHSGSVSIVFENLPHGNFALTEHGSPHDGVPNTRTVGPVTSQETLLVVGEHVGATW